MTSIRTIVLGAAAMTAACAYNPPPVPLEARPADVERLAGRWTGSYFGEETARAGGIELILVAGDDHAHGDVVMIPRGSPHAYRPWHETGSVPEQELSRQLTIRFVAVDGGEITGELDPYRDPACDCRAHTLFRGRVRGDLIKGSFVTHTSAGASHGTWEVRRKRR